MVQIFQIRRMSIKGAAKFAIPQSLNLTVAQTATLAGNLRLLFLFGAREISTGRSSRLSLSRVYTLD